MPDSFAYSRTVRYNLPLLFAGQAQKEGFVNEIAALTDLLLHAAIEGEAARPPLAPSEAQCWLVGAGPSGDWAGHAGEIAARLNGAWWFIVPRDGLRLLNRATGQELFYKGGWQIPPRPQAPSGGTMIDSEARNAIGALIACLTTAGLIPAS